MDLEVDQSGRIENVRHTALAVSDGEQRSLLIPASAKREVFGRLRRRGDSSKRATVRIFAAALYLLIAPVMGLNTWIVIDLEYPGYEPLIKSMLLRWLRKQKSGVAADQLQFRRIGRSSPAHKLAIGVYQRRFEPDHVVSVRELMSLFGK